MTIVLKVSLIVPFPTAQVRFSDDFYDDRHAGADPGGPNGVEEAGEAAQPQTLQIVLETNVYNNHYSVVKGYFRFEKLLRNHYFTRYRVLKLRCLVDYNIISYVNT